MRKTKNYAIKYYNERIDIIIYFTSKDKEQLKKFAFLCDAMIYGEQEDYLTILKLLKKNNIKVINNEIEQRQDNEFEIINSYSYDL
jgi:hypothetical protein